MGDMDAILKSLAGDTAKRAVIVGGGYIGLEMAEALRQRKLEVSLVELSGQVMGVADPEMASPLHQQLELHGVDLRLNTSVTEFRESSRATPMEALLSTGETIPCDLAIIAVGVRPDSRLARDAGLALDERGAIVVDEHMRTSDTDIYAVGDAVQVKEFVSGASALIPLAGPANRQGRIAADNIFGRDSHFRGAQGTAICKVFDLAIGMTGLSEKALKRAGIPHEKVYVHPASHASYYPGAQPLSLKLLFDPQDGRVLGAQAVGAKGVDKRIDVLAVAIRAGMTVHDLEELELSYAPPFGSAKDPVNYAGFVAANVLRKDMAVAHSPEFTAPSDAQLILDVRTQAETTAGTIPGAIHIPLDDLRARLDELPREKEILVFCRVGLRGYLACRILAQNGFRCRNLTGGFMTFAASRQAPPKPRQHTAPAELRDDSGAERKPAAPAASAKATREVDARDMQCPGPIMRLHSELATMQDGESLTIRVSDSGFVPDVRAWCQSTGNELRHVGPENGSFIATVVRRSAAPAACAVNTCHNKTIVVFSSDFDRVMAAFIIANGAAAMGSQVTLFFTFWGLNALRRGEPVSVRKTLIEKMFGWMMPRGPEKLALSQMNMGGMGLRMIKGIMKNKNAASLPSLIDSAQRAGVRLVACTMSMDLMGIKHQELIDGVELGGVAMYLNHAEAGNVNLFI